MDDICDTAALLTRAFLPAPESITGRDAKYVAHVLSTKMAVDDSLADRDFCMRALLAPPSAMMLVAQLIPYGTSPPFSTRILVMASIRSYGAGSGAIASYRGIDTSESESRDTTSVPPSPATRSRSVHLEHGSGCQVSTVCHIVVIAL